MILYWTQFSLFDATTKVLCVLKCTAVSNFSVSVLGVSVYLYV
jgi:hypothetical protein